MNRSLLIILIVITVAVGCAVGFMKYQSNQTNELPADLHEKFGCDRQTLDYRETDKYCGNYDLYKKDHTAGKT